MAIRKETPHEIALDVWRSARSRYRLPEFGPGFRVYRDPLHLPSFMKSPGRFPMPASSGWRGIGRQLVTITSGFGDTGSVLRLKEHTGPIRITTTIAKAGKCTKDIGTTRTTTATTGATMIVGMVITTTTSTTRR